MTDPDYRRLGMLRRQPGDDTVWRSEGKQTCPHCGSQMDAQSVATGGDGPAPRPENGDYTVCLRCLGLMRFIVGPLGFGVRKATDDEEAEFEQLHGEVRAKMRAYWDTRGGLPGPYLGPASDG